MSRTIRQTALSGLFGSKRFIVAVCAAIAMVLGALSVGASVFVPQSPVEGPEQAAQSPVFTERRGTDNANDKNSDGNTFTQQHTLMPGTLTPPKATDKPAGKTSQNRKPGLGIQFGPVNINTGINLGTLQIKVNTSVTQPAIEVIPEVTTPSVEVPAIETPKEEVPEEPVNPPVAEKPNETVETLSVTTDATAQQ